MTKPEKSFRYSPEELAEHFAMPVEQVVEIAETGDLLSDDGTIDLIRYLAFMIGEQSHAE